MISVKTASVIFAIILIASPALAGSCRYGSFGGRSVVSCQGGYFQSSRGGRTESFGFRNGGYERYPTGHLPPFSNERVR